MPGKTAAYAALSAASPLESHLVERRDPGPADVQIEILYCGVCHSDLHTARAEWPDVFFPVVPGHEIVGRVTKVGREVTLFKAGDLAAVGCMVDSCRGCRSCESGREQYCEKEIRYTFNSPDPHFPGRMTYGGYSKSIVVDERFVLRIPGKAELSAVAPLLCAGISTYSPLKHWGAGRGKKVGIVGLGGLGHMGVKISHALGAHTVMFTTTSSKGEDARRLGADEVVISKDANAMAKHAGSFDFILNTVAAPHHLDEYVELLRADATLCLVGVPATQHPSITVTKLISRRRSITGSSIGGIQETQEMLDFCATRGILSDVEVIPIQKINEAYERMLRSDVRYRFVIDMASLPG